MLDDNHEMTIFTIPSSSSLDLRYILGFISAQTTELINPESSAKEFYVQIGYLDYITHQENKEHQTEDF